MFCPCLVIKVRAGVHGASDISLSVNHFVNCKGLSRDAECLLTYFHPSYSEIAIGEVMHTLLQRLRTCDLNGFLLYSVHSAFPSFPSYT